MHNQKLTEAAERISTLFGADAFSEQTFKVRDILADLAPSFEAEKKEMKHLISSAIDELESALSSLN